MAELELSLIALAACVRFVGIGCRTGVLINLARLRGVEWLGSVGWVGFGGAGFERWLVS